MKSRHLTLALALAASSAAYAAAPDTEVVEFYNTFTHHYFITGSAQDVRIIEDGGAGAGWVKTGRSFQAWSATAPAAAGAAPVCRFYSPGANSHFFTASTAECDQLKALEAAERRVTSNPRGWTFEGVGFQVAVAKSGQCPAGTNAIQRFYNHGFESGEGANHRYVDDAGAAELMAQSGWTAEGAAFCAQAKPTGTQANLPATTTSFTTLAGTWTGTGKFEVETGNTETESRAPLSVTIDDAGVITGTGAGCTFTGQVATGDGFRSLFMGTVTAAGCTDPTFNGTFARVKLERFDAFVLKVRFQREDATTEVSIDATLTTDTPNTPPTTPPAASFDLIDGDWVGTLRWEAESAAGEVQANHALSLSISTAGVLSGSGFGCTVAGQLTPGMGGEFTGTATFSGCENAAFNGTFDSVRVKSEGTARIEARFKRESGGTEVEIEGTLDQGSTTTLPNPNPTPGVPAPTVTGSWSGAVSFSGGSVRATDTLTLTVGTDGKVTGSSRGCAFAGTLTLDAAGRQATGTLIATGCTDTAFNGTYSGTTLKLEDGSRLEVEMERGDVKIEGTISRH